MAMTFPPNRQASFLPPLPASSLAMPVAGQQQASPNYVPARSNPPNPDYFSNIIGAYQNKQATQKQQGGFVQDILSKRFTPTRDDRMTAYNRSTDALYAPNVFKAATPEDVASERAALELTPYSLMAKNAGSTPSAVQEYQYYNTLTPDEQRRYLEVKRNPQFLNLGDRFLAPGSGQAYAKGIPPDEMPEFKGAQSAATTAAKTRAESQATAQIDLPRVVDNANYAIKKIQELRDHPQMNAIFGLQGAAFPIIPGSGGADALARYKQITGQNFLSAYETLKGAGQITEMEGQKATEAIARLDRAQDANTARQAMNDLIAVVQTGVARAKGRAGTSVIDGVPSAFDPATSAQNDPLGIR